MQGKSRGRECLRLSADLLQACDILDIGKATDDGLAMGIHTRDLARVLLYARGI